MLDIGTLLTHTEDLDVETFDWGTLQWLGNGRLMPGAAQTLGLSEIKPGQRNPLHYHPNCEELLHVVAGRGRHRLGTQTVPVRPGTTVRIPAGVEHQLLNEGDATLVCFIVFSSPNRQTVFLDESGDAS
jgi:mannose-6-phosphate isomerase-like protein (cupin superfamily)